MMLCTVVGELLYDTLRVQVVEDGGKITVEGLNSRYGLGETELFRLLNT